MAFTKIVGAGIHTLSNVHTHNVNSSGIITATSFVGPFNGSNGDFSGNVTIDGNLTVNGTTTTLDTNLTEVDKLEVSANNSTVGAAITQSGSGDILNLYDSSTEVFSVADGGGVTLSSTIDVTGQSTFRDRLQLVDGTPEILLSVPSGGFDSRILNDGSGNLIIGHGTNSDTPTEKLRISSQGNVSIGSTANALRRLDVVGNSLLVRPTIDNISSFGNASAVNNSIIIRMPYGENPASTNHGGARFGIQFTAANNTTDVSSLNWGDDPVKSASIYGVSEDNLGYNRKVGLAFYTSEFDAAQEERLRIKSTGAIIKGNSGTQVSLGNQANTQIIGNSSADSSMALIRTAQGGGEFYFAAGSSGTNIANNNGLGFIKFMGYHTDGYDEYARIQCYVDGTNGNGDAPGRITVRTTPDSSATSIARVNIKSDGTIGIGNDVSPSAGDLQSGDSQNKPLIHVKGTGVSATGGEFNLLGRFEAGGDANDTGAMIVLNHSNDRGLALIGGRGTDNKSFGAIKSIDNQGRLTDVMAFGGENGQGVEYLTFYTGNSTTTTERLRINSVGIVSSYATHPQIILKDPQNRQLSLRAPSTSYQGSLGTDTVHDLSFYTAGYSNERLRITSAGDVGISSTSPRARLDVKDANTGHPVILRVSADNATPYALVVGNDTHNTDANNGLAMWVGGSKTHHIQARTSETASENKLEIEAYETTIQTGTSMNQNFVFDSSGRLLMNGATSNNAFSGGDDLIIGNTSGGRSGITLVSDSSNDGGLYFSDGTSGGNAHVQGQVVYNHNGNFLRLYTSATERFRITSDGNIGIGTEGNTSPTAPLSVKVGAEGEYFLDVMGSATKQFGLYYDQGSWGSAEFGIHEFDSSGNASKRFTIANGGKVGINETSPDSLLHITTNSSAAYSTSTINTVNSANALLRLENTNGGDGSGVNNYVGIYFRVANGANSDAQLQYVRSGDNAGTFHFKARNAGSTYPNLMAIKSDGNTGFNGTIDPKSSIHLGSNQDLRIGGQYGGLSQIMHQMQYAAGYTGTHWQFETNNQMSWCFDGVLIVYGGGGSTYGSEVTKITIVYSRENGANNSGDIWRNGTTSYNVETLGHGQVGLNPGAGELTVTEDTAPDGAASQRSLLKLGWTTAGHGGATTIWSKLHGTFYWGTGTGGSVEIQDKDNNIVWNSNP